MVDAFLKADAVKEIPVKVSLLSIDIDFRYLN